MSNKKLSVIIPVYKVEKYLDRCIGSVVNQTYQDLEIILVNDGSPDTCPEKCDKWSERDARIKVIHKKNGGVSSARNAGLHISTGNLITFVDSDDYIKPAMYCEMIDNLEYTNSDIVCCGRIKKAGTYEIVQQNCLSPKVYSPSQAMHELLIKNSMDEAVWDKIYRREIFDGIIFPVGEVNEDILVSAQVISKSKRISHVGNAYYYYWQTPNGITKSRYNSKMSVVVEHMKSIDEFVLQNYPELDAERRCFQARYAIDMLENMMGSPGSLHEYPCDYEFYLEALRKNYYAMIPERTIDLKIKIKGLLIILRLYAPIKKIVKGLQRWIIIILKESRKGYYQFL